MDKQKYLLSHPNYKELEIPEYTAHRLKLMTPSIGYAKASLAWVSDKEVGQYMGTDFSNISLEGEEKRLEEIVKNVDAYNWIIECDGKAIGNVNISDIGQASDEFGLKSGKLNYIIGYKNLWGKGIATVVAKTVLKWAFTKSGFEVVKTRVVPQNKSSQAVLKKLGFIEYGKEEYDGPNFGEPTWYIIYKLTKNGWAKLT